MINVDGISFKGRSTAFNMVLYETSLIAKMTHFLDGNSSSLIMSLETFCEKIDQML